MFYYPLWVICFRLAVERTGYVTQIYWISRYSLSRLICLWVISLISLLSFILTSHRDRNLRFSILKYNMRWVLVGQNNVHLWFEASIRLVLGMFGICSVHCDMTIVVLMSQLELAKRNLTPIGISFIFIRHQKLAILTLLLILRSHSMIYWTGSIDDIGSQFNIVWIFCIVLSHMVHLMSLT